MDRAFRGFERNPDVEEEDKLYLVHRWHREGIIYNHDEPLGPLDLKESKCSECGKNPPRFSDCTRCVECSPETTGCSYGSYRQVRTIAEDGLYMRTIQIFRCLCCQHFYLD